MWTSVFRKQMEDSPRKNWCGILLDVVFVAIISRSAEDQSHICFNEWGHPQHPMSRAGWFLWTRFLDAYVFLNNSKPSKNPSKVQKLSSFSNKVSLAQQKEKSFFFALVGNSLRRFLEMWHTLTYAEYRDTSGYLFLWMLSLRRNRPKDSIYLRVLTIFFFLLKWCKHYQHISLHLPCDVQWD